MRARTLIPLTVAAGATVAGYATLIERNWFALRRFSVPVLPPGAAPVRVLHISDAHLTPGRKLLAAWIQALDQLDPDLVINTGDSIAHPQAVPVFLEALGPLLDRPGAFVLGSNDMYSPEPRNPARYLYRRNHGRHERRPPNLPWEKLCDGMTEAGWLDLNNRRGALVLGPLDIALAGVHDSHVRRDRYDQVAGRADAAAGLRLGVMHSPEPRLLDQFVADGYDLLLAGHTHGGQLRVPFYGTLVTNCGLDRERARGLHQYSGAWLHVSAGLGTSPWAPARFACRPEASLLTLVPDVSAAALSRGTPPCLAQLRKAAWHVQWRLVAHEPPPAGVRVPQVAIAPSLRRPDVPEPLPVSARLAATRSARLRLGPTQGGGV